MACASEEVQLINEQADCGLESKSQRKDKSRINAQSRRTTHSHLLKELGSLLPFPEKVVQQIDYNSILRLVLCYFRMKNLAIQDGNSPRPSPQPKDSSNQTALSVGRMQDLMTEALDGFVLVLLSDGTIVYLSDNIHKYLGLFQSEHIGTNIFDLILTEDHKDVKDALRHSEINSMSRLQDGAPCSFFCRMKCPKFKMAMCAAKSPGYKLMYVSGHFKMDGTEPRMVAVVRPVSPPSILEIRMEGNMFVTHYQLDMRCTFFDGRLQQLLGYTKADMLERLAFDLHHHEDIEPCQKCHAGLLKRGEGVSGYYRLLNKWGQFIWCQTRAHMMFDSRSSKPSYIVCMNFIISKEDGEESLAQRAIEAATSREKNPKEIAPVADHSYDPFPVTSDEWSGRDPFSDSQNPTQRSLSPEQQEADSTVKSRTPSPNRPPSKSPVSDTMNSSPQLGNQLSVDSNFSAMVSPLSKQSVSSMESGYASSISSPPSLVQMRNSDANSPVFHQETPPQQSAEQIPNNTYYQQKPQINFLQNGQPFEKRFHSPNQYQPSHSISPTANLHNSHIKQEPFTMNQCAGSKRTHSLQQPVMTNPLLGLNRPANSGLGFDLLMPSISDQIPSIGPLTELKTEDLGFLEIPPQNAPQMQPQQPTHWPQNVTYVPTSQQFGIPQGNLIHPNMQGNFPFNPHQFRTGPQPHFVYRAANQ